jgi:hypothetical protein
MLQAARKRFIERRISISVLAPENGQESADGVQGVAAAAIESPSHRMSCDKSLLQWIPAPDSAFCIPKGAPERAESWPSGSRRVTGPGR